MPAPFNKTLNSNEIFGAIANMIISQQVFADNIKGTSAKLADMCRVDGSLYGDTKLYYSSDVLKTHAWGNDAEAASLLALDRPAAPFCQKVVLDKFRQIRLTVDDYLSKRAWGDEYAFSQFTSVMESWLSETKKVYDSTLVNAYVGGTQTLVNGQLVDVAYPADGSGNVDAEALNRIYAQSIAKAIADVFTTLTDINRVNDLGFLRSYNMEDLVVVWNADVVNKLKKLDMPTIWHKEGLIDKFEEVVLPKRYFTSPAGTTLTISTYAAAAYDAYANEEMDVLYKYSTTHSRTIHYFPGDVIAKTVKSLTDTQTLTIVSYTDDVDSTAQTTFKVGTYRLETSDHEQVCKIIHKDSLPFMSAFETGTNFFNPRSLTETHYLTFGHNTLQYLYDKPWITVTATQDSGS